MGCSLSLRYHAQNGSWQFLVSFPVLTGLCFCKCSTTRTWSRRAWFQMLTWTVSFKIYWFS